MKTGTGSAPTRTLTADSQLMQDYLQSTGILVSSTAAPAIAAFQNADGEDEAVVIDVNGNLNHVCREPLSDSGWNMYGLGAGFQAIAAVDSATLWAIGRTDGALWQGNHGRWVQLQAALPGGQALAEVSVGTDGTVWALDANGGLYVMAAAITQTPPALSATVTPVAIRDPTDLLHLFCVDGQGSLWALAQTAPTGAWGAWTALSTPSGVQITTLAVGPNQDGRLQVFAIGSDHALHTVWETAPGTWSGWDVLAPLTASGTLASVAVGQNQDGRLEVFALCTDDGTVRTIWQTAPNNGWSSWASLGAPSGVRVTALAVAQNQDGRLELFAVCDGVPCVAHTWQTAPNEGWSSWHALSDADIPYSPTMGALALTVGRNQDGRLEVFALSNQFGLVHSYQESPSRGPWSSWAVLGKPSGVSLTAMAVGQDASGILEILGLTTDGTLWHTWQTRPGWSHWNSLGAPAGLELQQLVVVQDGTGRLDVFGCANKAMWQIQQTAPSSTWGGWLSTWRIWRPLDGAPALQHAPSGSGGSCWAVAKSEGALASWNGSQWSTATLPQSQQAAWVSVGADDTVWVLATTGALFQYTDQTFRPLPGSLTSAGSFSGSGAPNLWATGQPGNYGLYQYAYGSWQEVETPPLMHTAGLNWPQVSVAPDGSVWLLDGSGTVWRQAMGSPWRWAARPVPAGVAYLASLTASGPGSTWAVDNTGRIWSFSGTWTQLPAGLPNNAAPDQVAAGAPGTLWAIDTNGNPYQYFQASSQWQAVPSSVLPQLAQAPTTWALGRNGTIWQFAKGGWVQFFHELPNAISPAQVVAGADGSLWALDVNGGLYQYVTAQSAWQQIPRAPAGLLQVAPLDPTSIWAIAKDPDDAGSFILYQCMAGAWQQVAGAPVMSPISATPQVSVGSDGTVWLLDGNGIPRVVGNQAASNWSARKAGVSLQSVAASGIGEAWAVGADGGFWRNFGSGWVDAEAPLPARATATQVSVGSDGTVWALDDAGRLYTQGAAHTPALPGFDISVPPEACRDASGNLQLFCTGTDGAVWTTGQSSTDGWWGGFISLGGPSGVTLQSLALGLDENRCLQVFAIGAGALWRNGQTAPGSGWGSWSSLGAPAGAPLANVTAGSNQDGHLLVFAIAANGAVHTISESAPGAWSWDVNTLPQGAPVNTLAVGLNQNGCLEVVALGTDQTAYYIVQTAPNGGWGVAWTPWGTPAGVSQLRSLVLGSNQNGCRQLFAISAVNTIYTKAETAAGAWSDWSAFTPLPGVLVDSLAVGLDQSGCMEIVAVRTDQTVQLMAQAAPNGGWSPWSPILRTPATGAQLVSPVVAQAATGALAAFVFAAGTTPPLWTIRQQDGAAWGTWVPLGQAQPLSWSPVSGAPTLLQAPSGSASDCWAINSSGELVNWTGLQWDTKNLPGLAVAASVSVGTDGSVWAVTAPTTGSSGEPTNACYQRLSGTTRWWQQVGGDSFAQAPAGSANDLWCVTFQGGINRSPDGGDTWWQDTAFSTAARQLTVGSDGTVWLLDTGGTASISPAWQRIMPPTGMAGWPEVSQCATVVAGRDENGVPYAFFTDQNGALHYSYEVFPRAWVTPVLFPGTVVSSLGLANQQDTGELIVYGMSGSADLVAVQKPQGSSFDFSFSIRGASFSGVDLNTLSGGVELCAVDAGHWYWFSLLAPPSAYAGALIMAAGSADALTFNFSLVQNGQTQAVPTGFASVLRLPWARPVQAPSAAVLDGSNNVHIVSMSTSPIGGNYPGDFLALTGSATPLPTGVEAVAAVLQSDIGSPPQPRLYAMAPITPGGTNALWVRRQIDLSVPVSQPSAWSSWIPLDSGYLALVNGPSLLDTESLFAVSSDDGSLHSVSQDPLTGKWTSLEVNRPSQSGDEIDEVSVYGTEITIYDGNGIPEANVPVTITAESPLTIRVEDVMYVIDSGQGVTCPTSATGKLHTRTLATGLHTPSLIFQADGLVGGSQSVNPAQNVHDFLAGTGQLAVGGGQPASFTAQTLVGATVNGQSLSPGLTSETAGFVAKTAGTISRLPSSGASAGATVAGWAVNLSDPAHPTFQTFSTAAALEAYRRRLHRCPPGDLAGWSWNPWHDITHAAEDVVHAISNGVIQAEDFVVDAESKVVSFTIKIGGQIVGTFDMVIQTVADAMGAIEALMKTLIADIELIIEWLKLLFAWEDIWATKEKIEQFLQEAFSFLQGQVGTVQAAVHTVFTNVTATLSQDFDTLVTYLQSDQFPYKTFGDLPSKLPSAPALRAVAAVRSAFAAGPSIPGTSGVHFNWLLSKALRSVTPSFSLGSAASLNPQGLFTALAANNVLADMEQAVTDFETYLTDVFAHPADLAQLTIVGFLQEAKDLLVAILDIIAALAQAVLDMATQMLAAMDGSLNHHLDIPVISPLYKLITTLFGDAEDLTVMHLYALLTAVPLTIICKLVFGRTPFSGLNVEKGPGMPPEEIWKICFAVNGFVAWVVAILRDGYTILLTPQPPGVSATRWPALLLAGLFGFIFLLQQIFSWPGGVQNGVPPHDTSAEVMAIVNWALYWIVTFLDWAFLVLMGVFPDVPLITDARFLVRTGGGNYALATAIVWIALVLAHDRSASEIPGFLFALCKPLPLMMCFLLIPPIRQAIWEASGEWVDPAWCKLVVDTIVLAALPALHFES